MDYKSSIEKIEKLKNRHIYFNHHSELRNYTQMDFTQIPQEYHYFISQDKSIEALYYYNSYYFRMLHKAENEAIKKEIALREERHAAQLKARKQRSSKSCVKKDTN